MDRFRVRSGAPLEGSVRVQGATKNSGLKILAAALLARGASVVSNAPMVGDLEVFLALLRSMGARVTPAGHDAWRVDVSGDLQPVAPYELVTRLRASINVLGPLLGRCGEARVALPGGDDIGNRKLDMHFDALRAMGAEIDIVHGYIEARAPVLTGARVVLEFPSVGATENILAAAVRAKGATVIENAAREPEITDLAAFLVRMGAQITGAGTSTIEVHGTEDLGPADAELMPDRIEAGTLLMAAGVAGGEIVLEGARFEHLEMLVSKLGQMGMKVSPVPEGVWARADRRLTAVDIATLPFPGFATDLMPLATAMLAVADGTSIVTENLFDRRLAFASELNRMGASILTEGRHLVVRGVERLSGAPVRALDVRAGAALVVAGLAADGETEVYDPFHVDRGFVDLAGSLRALGADVERAA